MVFLWKTDKIKPAVNKAGLRFDLSSSTCPLQVKYLVPF